jgi:hypothetical protein
MKTPTIALAAAFVFASTSADAAPKRYAFKGAVPGMSLSDFMALPFPDAERMKGTANPPRAYRVRCSKFVLFGLVECYFEAWNSIRPPICKSSNEQIAAHIKKVNRSRPFFVSRRDWGKRLNMQDVHDTCFQRIDVGYGNYKPRFGGVSGSDIAYKFYRGRLMKITIRVYPGDTDKLVPILKAFYGRPKSQRSQIVQNAFAVRFRNLVTIWDNGQDRIEVQRYAGTTDAGHFAFVHKPTLRLYNAERRKAARTGARNF